MKEKLTEYFWPLIILLVMFLLMFFSSLKDTATADEPAHIPSGYTYLKYQDYRLNIEHPPVLKAISAVPLVFNNLDKFPKESFEAIQSGFWGAQWGMGVQYLYEAGNSPARILLLARLPMMILALVFGFLIYLFAKDLYGKKAGILALIFFVFSPTILAHSRLVTTDVGIAFASFCVIASFGYLLKSDYKKKWIVLTALALGFAFLAKFSAITILPSLALMFLWDFFTEKKFSKKDLINCTKKLIPLSVVFLIATMMVYIVYALFMLRMPNEIYSKEISEVFVKNVFNLRTIFTEGPVFLRPFFYYLSGFAYVFHHTTGGHLSYFLGNLSAKGVWYYFPLILLLKTQLVLWIFLLFGLLHKKFRFNVFEIGMISFIFVYMALSMRGSLNIGIRHVIPILPFIFVFASNAFNIQFQKYTKYAFYFLTIIYILPSFIVFPYYISYANIIVPKDQKYKYFGDSNLDWGQDLRRLSEYVERNKIQNIKVDYFGGGIPVNYYIPFAQKWTYEDGLPKEGYLAVSATHLQFSKRYQSEYDKLWDIKPYAQIGDGSILIYKFE